MKSTGGTVMNGPDEREPLPRVDRFIARQSCEVEVGEHLISLVVNEHLDVLDGPGVLLKALAKNPLLHHHVIYSGSVPPIYAERPIP